MKHKLTAGLLALSMLTAGIPLLPQSAVTVCAEETYTEYSENGVNYKIFSDYASAVGYDEASLPTDLTLPETVQGVPLTSIGSSAFENSHMQTVHFPANLKEIGYCAFTGCTELTEIDAEKTSLDYISSGAFNDVPWCEGQEFVILGDYLYSAEQAVINRYDESLYPEHSGPRILYGETNSKYTFDIPLEIIVPDGVRTIGENVFGRHEIYVTRLVLPESVTRIEQRAFEYCFSLADIQFSGTISYVAYDAFYGCLWKVRQPYAVLGTALVGGSERQTLVIPEGVTYVADFCFKGVYTEDGESPPVTCPASLRSIGDSAFYGVDFPSLTLNEGLELIGDSAFSGTGAITEVTIPSTVKQIGNYAFLNSSLKVYTILSPDVEFGIESVGWSTQAPPEMEEPGVILRYHHPLNDVTIRGYDGSSAETYAQKNGFTFESLGAIPETSQPTPDTIHEDSITLGDLNGDSTVNAADGAAILIAAARLGAGETSGLTASQESAADLDGDGSINASDAAAVLQYAAFVGAGGTAPIGEFLQNAIQT